MSARPVTPFAEATRSTTGGKGHPVRPEPDLRCAAASRSAGRSRSSARRDEVGRNAFHFPPLHVAARRRCWAEGADPPELVTTAGFEFVRPGREDDDRRPTFQPNSLLVDAAA